MSSTTIQYGRVRGGSGTKGQALAYNGAFWVPAAALPTGSPGTANCDWSEGQLIPIAVPAPSGPGGGTGGGSVLVGSYTMPAVNSTGAGTATVQDGTAFSQGYSVAITVAGLPSYLTVTNVAGNVLTLLNNGGPTNVAPTTVIANGSVITVASTNGPIAGAAPSPGQSLMLGLNGLYNPVGTFRAKSLWEFGVVGDGVVDDQPAIQAACNFMVANPRYGVLYAPLPPVTYLLKSTLLIALSPSLGFRFVGDCGTSQPFVTSFSWGGSGTDGIIVKLTGGRGFRMEHIVINGNGFAGSTTAAVALQMLPILGNGAAAHMFENCQFSAGSVVNYRAYRQNSHLYAPGDVIIGPDSSVPYWATLPTDNGHIYQCSVGGTSGAGPIHMNTAAGSSTPGDGGGGGVTWTEIGISPCGVLVGDAYNDIGAEVSECGWTDCEYRGNSGWRQVNGGNVKNFAHTRPTFGQCGRGLDVVVGSGSYALVGAVFSQNSETDIYFSGSGWMHVDGWASEGSARLLSGFAPASSCVAKLEAGYYAGNVTVGLQALIHSTCDVIIEGNNFETSLPGTGLVPVTIICAHASLQSGATSFATFISKCNTYQNSPALNLLDGSGNPLLGVNTLQNYSAYQSNIISLGDKGTSGGSSEVHFPNYFGSDIVNTRQRISQRASDGEVPASHVTLHEQVGQRNPVMLIDIDYTLLTAAATTQTFTIAAPFNRTKIENVLVDVTAGFTGLTTPTVTVGKIVPVGGSATANAYITAGGSLAAPTGASPIGKASGNLGASLPGDMVWGPTYDGTSATQWAITITISAANNVNLASAGRLTVYAEFQVYPGI